MASRAAEKAILCAENGDIAPDNGSFAHWKTVD